MKLNAQLNHLIVRVYFPNTTDHFSCHTKANETMLQTEEEIKEKCKIATGDGRQTEHPSHAKDDAKTTSEKTKISRRMNELW